jgi:hypothetical protein
MMVEGLNVDNASPKPDCATCMEAKQACEPYKVSEKIQRAPGELTHIDVWGSMT